MTDTSFSLSLFFFPFFFVSDVFLFVSLSLFFFLTFSAVFHDFTNNSLLLFAFFFFESLVLLRSNLHPRVFRLLYLF